MTVVFDSGVWISALEFDGVPQRAIEHARAIDEILFCAQIEDEIVRVMGKKFGYSEERVQQGMPGLLAGSTRVFVAGTLTDISRDPNDDFILECATAGRADLIVTGDKGLLSLAAYEGTLIVTPRQYLDRAQSSPRGA